MSIRIALLSIMNGSTVILGLWILGVAISGGQCDTIAFQPGLTYSWIIPPQSRIHPPQNPTLSSADHPERPSDDAIDQRNEAPLTNIGGYGHPPFYRRHSHEQLSLPNEFLITPGSYDQRNGGGGRGFFPMPIFRQLDPVDCDGDPTCLNVDITQQLHPTTIHQGNIASVPSAVTPPDYRQQQHRTQSSPPAASLGQPVSWPSISGDGGGIGLLFFVSESASHLPVEQLIPQQLALHRTQFPFDISINCEDAAGLGCRPAGGGLSLLLPSPRQPPPPPPPSPPSTPPATAVNEWNAENGNYASIPLDEIDNGSSSSWPGSQGQQRKWRTISERLVRNKHRLLQQQDQLQQQQQQNQQGLSILP